MVFFCVASFSASLVFSCTSFAYVPKYIAANPDYGSQFQVRYSGSTDNAAFVVSSVSYQGVTSTHNTTSVLTSGYSDITLDFLLNWSASAHYNFPVTGFWYYDFTITPQFNTLHSTESQYWLDKKSDSWEILDQNIVSVSDGLSGSLSAFIVKQNSSTLRLYIYFSDFDYEAISGITGFILSFNPVIRYSLSYTVGAVATGDSIVSSNVDSFNGVSNCYINCNYTTDSVSGTIVNASDYSLSAAIVKAIDEGSVDIDTIIDFLIDIKTVDQSGFSSIVSNLNALLDHDRIVNIIVDALNQVNPTEEASEVANQNEILSNLTQTQSAIEHQIFDQASGALDDIQFDVPLPSGLIASAVSLMRLVGQFWDTLGVLQYAAIITLISGLIIVIIGVVNRYVRADAREQRRNSYKNNGK